MTGEKKTDYKKMMKTLSKNYWAISTVVLAILLVGILIYPTISSTTISPDKASQKTQTFLSDYFSQSGITGAVAITEIEKISGMYQMVFSVDGQPAGKVTLSQDGKYIGQMDIIDPETIAPTQQSSESQDIPKSDKPEVELFIWSYCPYGVTAQAPFAEVSKLISNNANFQTVLYYDGHGPFETQQNKIQACIQKYSADKYENYELKFVSDVYPICSQSREVSCDLEESKKVMRTVGIDSTKILSCVEDEGEALLAIDSQRAKSLGVTGSPTLVINGVKANVARDAESYKNAICSAFTDAPEQCAETLSSAAATTTGNC